MSTITREQLIEDLKSSTQNSSGMFEIGEETICALMSLLTSPPAPVSVPDEVMAAMQKVARIRLDLNDFDGDKRGILDCLGDAEEALIEVVNRRAAMLKGAVNAESRCTIHTAPALDSSPKNAESRGSSSPVIPDGWAMVPVNATRAMIDAAARVEEDGYDAMLKAMLAAAPQQEVKNG